MLILIGSERAPKVNAVKAAFEKILPLAEFSGATPSFFPCSAESGIAAMPMTLQELMLGARNRARSALNHLPHGNEAAFSIGLEGGFFQETVAGHKRFFLQSWAYVEHPTSGQGSFGSSAAIPVPEQISAEILASGAELGEVIDRYGRERNIRDKGGAFEVFSKGLVNRQGSFELAIICAMAPFYQTDLYR